MAETAGLVVGGIGLAALFNSVVDCYGYASLGASFERDFATSQLLLEDSRWRLHRWGRAVDVQDEKAARSQLGKRYSDAGQLLEQIKTCLDVAQKKSVAYRHADPEPKLKGDAEVARATIRSLCRPPQRISRRAIWALHDHEALNRIINDIGSLLTALERISPAAELQRSAETDIKILGSPDALQTLLAAVEQGSSKAADRILQKAAKQQAGHLYSRTTNIAKAKTLMGDLISKSAARRLVFPRGVPAPSV
ncbi:hypothetical protein EKO04_005029 [Ascochyta lentis]|uniref:Prion-inhibition and propagation HeLo domain-containing protein n=1 Tax=Ascochyta lentis TaxID=205686 RepID=A0A8H7J5C3_9PLEO|nr:hypothetical protein EKO04_005029 [Ascochyta lentis]